MSRGLYQLIRQLIESSKVRVLVQVNQTLVLTYWQIGKTIQTELLNDGRAQYCAGILKQLTERLTQEYGTAYSATPALRGWQSFTVICPTIRLLRHCHNN